MDLVSSSIALAAFAEFLLEGRRVVVFGDATSSLSTELVERGARGVHVYDPDPTRAALAAGRNRSKQISVTPLDEADLAVRDGAFEVAIVEDLSQAQEPASLLKRARRALAARGTAIVACPNPEAKLSLLPRTGADRGSTALGYYDLYDAVSAEFSEVRMLGQTPFVGYAIVDFAPEGEPDVDIDTELVPGGAEEPEWFVAIASREPVECGAFGIVQLPTASVFAGRDDERRASELRAARAAEASMIERVAALEAEAAELRARPPVVSDGAKERATALESDLRALASEKDDLQKRIQSLSTDRDRLGKLVASLTEERDGLRTELSKRDAERAALEARLADREAQIQKLVGTPAPAEEGDIARLEETLKERGARVLRLEADLRESERVGHELVRELSRRTEAGVPSPPESEALTAQNARLAGDLEAAGWTIQELEDRLSQASHGAR